MSESGLRLLIAEDEPLIAMMLEEIVASLGYRVAATVDSVADGLAALEDGTVDLAIVDMNLRGGERAWPLAEALEDRGIAFIFATGGAIERPPPAFAATPCLEKPFSVAAVADALESVAAK